VDRALARDLGARVNALAGAAPVNAVAALADAPPGTSYVEGFCVRHDEQLAVTPHAWLDTRHRDSAYSSQSEDDMMPVIVDPTPGFCEADVPDVVYFAVADWSVHDVFHLKDAYSRRGKTCPLPLLDGDLEALPKNVNWHWARIEAPMHAAAVYEERTGTPFFPDDFDFRRLLP
jgi:hypothetical protein